MCAVKDSQHNVWLLKEVTALRGHEVRHLPVAARPLGDDGHTSVGAEVGEGVAHGIVHVRVHAPACRAGDMVASAVEEEGLAPSAGTRAAVAVTKVGRQDEQVGASREVRIGSLEEAEAAGRRHACVPRCRARR